MCACVCLSCPLKRTCLHFAQVWHQIFPPPAPSRWPTDQKECAVPPPRPCDLLFFSQQVLLAASSTQRLAPCFYWAFKRRKKKVAEAAGRPGWQCYGGEMRARFTRVTVGARSRLSFVLPQRRTDESNKRRGRAVRRENGGSVWTSAEQRCVVDPLQ